ncbi:HU family DNA-binding protein [Teredinibacter purpureus]|jgi:Bacterial nucleoid DNA-binding protein|uniref:HU family DNA-binding protein n=1 Tax=Teredinibacter purpureus TaxID=2731756 RepID=UPI0005F8668B|nr:HU family DNA-binding protein [Teredinibacter purpureus]
MRKPELIQTVAHVTGLNTRQADDAVAALIEQMTNALARGESVNLMGFGAFSVKTRAERNGKHPKTGAPIHISPKNYISFKPSSALRSLSQPPNIDQ